MAPLSRPSLDEFLSAAREDNPGVSDADLSAYYRTEYGAPDTNYSLPSLPAFLKTAKEDNPDVPEHELRAYWADEYGSKGARETEPTGSDVGRGFQNTFKQIPQLLHGAEAGLGAAGESLFGEGGVSTSIKQHGLKGYQEDSAGIEANSKNSDQFLNAWESAKNGDLGGLADFLQYGLGYAGGQAVQMLATGGLGFVAGKMALQPIATTLAQRLVAKEVARIGETEAGKSLAASEISKLAVANVSGKIGQTVALAGAAVGMEGGEIGGDLAQTVTEEGRVASGQELAKAFGATLAAGLLEFAGDKIGLDLILGKSKIGKAVSGTGIANRLKGAAVSGTAGVVSEGTTEFAQTLIEEFGKGNDPFADESIREAINAAALGSVSGGTVGAGSGMIHRPAVIGKPAEETPPVAQPNVPGALDPKVYSDIEAEAQTAQEKAEAQYSLQAQAVTIKDIVSAPTIEEAIAKAAELLDSETAVLSKPPTKRASIPDVPVLPGAQAPPTDALLVPGQAFTPREADPMATIRAERERLVYENRGKLPKAAEPEAELQTVEPVKPLPTALSKAYPSVNDIHSLAESKGLEWDNNQVFKEMTKLVTGKGHLDDLTPFELQKMFDRLSKLQDAKKIEPATPAPTPTVTTAEGEPALPLDQPKQTEELSTFEAAQVPRGTLTDEQNAEMLARAEKAQADLEIAGNERGGRYFNKTQGQGSDQEVTGLKSATADWYKEATTGPKKLSKGRVDIAVQKIIADKGRDVGTDVQRIKELLLQDQEFYSSPFAPKDDNEWETLIAAATGQTTAETFDLDGPAQASDNPSDSTDIPEDNSRTDEKAHEAAPSPKNDLPEPTEGQKKAGNYKKGHIRMSGMDLSIENPAGSERSGTDASGKPWSITLKSHYGYIRGTKGKDKEHIDIFVKPGTPTDYSGDMFVIDQRKPGSKAFDEHKVIMGAADLREAMNLYEENYTKDWKGLGSTSTFTMDQFKAWLRDGDHTQPSVNYKAPQPVSTEREKLDAIKAPPAVTDVTDDGFSLTSPTETKPRDKGPEQLSIDVPAPTIGEKPIIGREVQPEEAPLFSKDAQTPEPEQTELSPSDKSIGALNGEMHGLASQKARISPMQIDEARELIGRAERMTEVDGDHLTGLQRRTLRANIRQLEERIRDENSGTSMPTWLQERAKAVTEEQKKRYGVDSVGQLIGMELVARKGTGVTSGKVSHVQVERDGKVKVRIGGSGPHWYLSDYEEPRAQPEKNTESPARSFESLKESALAIQKAFNLARTKEAKEAQAAKVSALLQAFKANPGLITADEIRSREKFFNNILSKMNGDIDQSDAVKALLSGRDGKLPDVKDEKDSRLVSATKKIADYVQRRLEEKYADGVLAFSLSELTTRADYDFGGTQADGKYTPKDLHDAMELGINQFIGEAGQTGISPVADVSGAKETVEWIRSHILEKIPSQQNRRTAEQDEFQQFSTPPDIAYVMNWVARLKAKDTVLEPSAGLGGLAVYANNVGANVHVNEFSARRASILRTMGFATVTQENAEQLHNILPATVKPTVVIMNPPFSSTAGRMEGERKSSNVVVHLNQALKRLQPGGRLVALIGKGKAEFGGETSRSVEDWIKATAGQYAYRARIGLSGEGYKKYGTTFDNQILVFDKVAPDDVRPVIANLDDVIDAIPLLKEVRDARNYSDTERAPAEQGSEAVADVGENPSRPGESVRAPADSVGARSPGRAPATGNGSTRSNGGGGVSADESQAGTGNETPANDRGQRGERVESGRGESGSAANDEGRGDGSDQRAGSDADGDAGRLPASRVESFSVEQADSLAPIEKADLTSDGIYEVYRPQKLKVAGSKAHPGELVESAAMSAVLPPDPTYQPNIAKKIITDGLLSIAQLEAIVGAGQAHADTLPDGTRKGYFIGDGTGVGKGREISGIILDNFNHGRKKALWISKSAGLVTDAKRDWSGIDQDPNHIFDLKGVKVSESVQNKKGVLFTTYNTLIQGLTADRGGTLIAATNKTTQKAKESRLDQIVKWLGPDFDGVVAFDEAHAMANAAPSVGKRGPKDASSTGLVGLELQKRLPNARIVYVSATGATEVANLAYAERLGLWGEGTAFANRDTFIGKMVEGGLAAMEVVAQNMKALGVYTSRQLSFRGVTYDRLEHELTPAQKEIYDEMARAWQLVFKNIQKALEATGSGSNAMAKGAAKAKFMSAEQRFFNQILTSMQMPSVLKSIQAQIDDGKAVVVQLVNTNEAGQTREMEKQAMEGGDLEDVDLTPKELLMQYVKDGFPTEQFETYLDENGKEQSRLVVDSNGVPVQNAEAVEMREELLNSLGSLRVPDGALEMLLDTFGEKQVAEVTGRQERLIRVKDEEGRTQRIAQKGRTQKVRQADAKQFMDDKKKILVFSDAGGTGASYHADRKGKNQRKRIHYLVQPGWRADNAVQGFGRTHRSDQAQPPHYVLVTTDLKGHKRFISSVARRLDQLGALTKGQRQTGTQGFFNEEDNLEGMYANAAVKDLLRAIYRGEIPAMSWKELIEQKMAFDNLINKETGKMNEERLPQVPQFLNRILALEYTEQNAVFEEFNKRMRAAIERAAANGALDVGLENFKADGVTLKGQQTVYTHPGTSASTQLLTYEAQHKISFVPFIEARKFKNEMGFYRSQKTGKISLAVNPGTTHTNAAGEVLKDIMLRTPIYGKYSYITERTLANAYNKLSMDEAKKQWDQTIQETDPYSKETVNLLSGVLLPIWDRLPSGFVRILRMTTDDGQRAIGRRIADDALNATRKKLGAEERSIAYTPESAVAELDEKGMGAKIVLANGWTIRTVRIGGGERYELRGENLRDSRGELEKAGLFMERIQFDPRWFIPSDQVTEVVEALTKYRPIIEVLGKTDESGLSSAQKMAPLGLPSAQSAKQETYNDPPKADAKAMESALKDGPGTLKAAAKYIVDNPESEDYKLIAQRVIEQMERLEAIGMKFDFRITHMNEKVPASLIGTRGLTSRPFDSDTTTVYLQGADVTGKVGMSQGTLLHELVHAVTQTAVYVGNRKLAKGTKLAESVSDLFTVTNAIIAHFNERAKTNKPLTEFEKGILLGGNNALQDPDEVLAWALTHRRMQEYLDTIPFGQSTLWQRFVQAVKSFFGIQAKAGSALAEVLRIADDLTTIKQNELLSLAKTFRQPSAINQTNAMVNNQRLTNFNRVEEDEGLAFDEATQPYTPETVEGRQEKLDIGEGQLAYELPAMSNMDAVIRTLQDKNIDMVRLVDAIKATGKTISDGLNPVLKEEMYMGRTSQRLQDFLNDELRPLVDHMRLHRVTMEQLDEYLHARHAQEANQHLKEINPELEDNEALSGMSDEKAQGIIAAAEPKMEKLAARVDAILGKTRDLMVDYGLEAPERVAAWKEQYAHYVPLHRSGFEDGTPGTGQGRSIRGSSVKSRTGSHRSVIDILANVALDREKTLVRGEKNRVTMALGALLQKHPNDEIAKLSKPAPITYTNEETGLLESAPGNLGEYRVPMVKGVSKKTGEVEWRPDPLYKGRDNVINFRLAGVDHSIVFNEHNPRAVAMAHALKDLDVGQLNTVMSIMGKATRYLAAINTQYNPVFGVVNFVRDIQFAMLTLSSTPLAGKRGAVWASTWRNLRGIYQDARAVRRGETLSSPVSELWRRFEHVGGPTGYRDLFRTSGDRAKAIEHMLDPDWWQKTAGGKLLTVGGVLGPAQSAILEKAGKPLFEWLSDYNQMMENAVRLGVFQAGIESGLSDEKAASLAKNITVNFNKKGQVSAQVGALYAFFNASVQGTARIAETLFEPGKFGVLSATGKKIIAGGVTAGAAQAFLLAIAGFGEDDPPDWLKDRSMIIPVPGTDKGYVSIPMPLGFNILPNFGRYAAETLLYGKPIDRGYRFMASLVDALSPVGGAGSFAQFISFTATDPIIGLAENKDWTGKPIYRDDFDKRRPTPGFTRAKDSATPWSRGLAELINYATGGTDYVPGKFSPTPDQIEYLISQVTGGVGRETGKAAQTVTGALTGEDVPLYKMPLAGRFIGSASGQSSVRSEFYENLRTINAAHEEVTGRRANGEEASRYMLEHPEFRLSHTANQLEREVSALSKKKRQTVRSGGSSEQVRLIEMQINSRMARLNEHMKSVLR